LKSLRLDNIFNILDSLKSQIPSPANGFGEAFIAETEKTHGVNATQVHAQKFLFESVFCHNDLLSGNILRFKDEEYQATKNRVQFIDFEYGCYNFRAFDLANHFCEYAGFDGDFAKWYPSKECQKHFLRCYTKGMLESDYCKEMKLRDIYNDQVLWEAFSDEVLAWLDKFAIASHLLWGIWAVVQAGCSPIDFDFLDYARLRFVPLKEPI